MSFRQWKKFCRRAGESGLPIIVVRDPKTQLGSVSLTLVFISFNTWLVSVIGKLAGVLGGLNTSDCLSMFLACAGLYWGRKFQKDGDKLELSSMGDESESPQDDFPPSEGDLEEGPRCKCQIMDTIERPSDENPGM